MTMTNTNEPRTLFPLFTPDHPWLGTQHCLRDRDGGCANDHTGCLWNDGHNACNHPAAISGDREFDSPLLRRSPDPE